MLAHVRLDGKLTCHMDKEVLEPLSMTVFCRLWEIKNGVDIL